MDHLERRSSPQATGEGHCLSVELTDSPDRSENPGRDFLQSFLSHVIKDNREFVPSQTGDRIRLPQQGFQSRSNRHKRLVSRSVSQDVVDRLEAVQVKESHGKGGLMANGVATGLFQSIGEESSVGKSGEGIVERQKMRPLLLPGVGLFPVPLVEGKGRLRETPSSRSESS